MFVNDLIKGDDPKVSVQTRGGPSKYEVTSWLQLLSLQPKDAANYWCIAKNEEGETSAAARIVVLDFEGKLLCFISKGCTLKNQTHDDLMIIARSS